MNLELFTLKCDGDKNTYLNYFYNGMIAVFQFGIRAATGSVFLSPVYSHYF